jgi:hypothetical protein
MNDFAKADQARIQAEKKKERDRLRMNRKRQEQEAKIADLEVQNLASEICIATLSHVISKEVELRGKIRSEFINERAKKRFAYFYLAIATA